MEDVLGVEAGWLGTWTDSLNAQVQCFPLAGVPAHDTARLELKKLRKSHILAQEGSPIRCRAVNRD
jgi:hypothetical protein